MEQLTFGLTSLQNVHLSCKETYIRIIGTLEDSKKSHLTEACGFKIIHGGLRLWREKEIVDIQGAKKHPMCKGLLYTGPLSLNCIILEEINVMREVTAS